MSENYTTIKIFIHKPAVKFVEHLCFVIFSITFYTITGFNMKRLFQKGTKLNKKYADERFFVMFYRSLFICTTFLVASG